MSNLRITKKYFGKLNAKILQAPRERFTRFYEDLYERFQLGNLDPKSYQTGGQYSYAELGDSILKQCETDGLLKDLDLLIFCYWTPEFDPEYSAGAYFCERYAFKGKILDICDQGILSPITAIKVIKSYFNHSDMKNALLVCLDQTTIPLAKKSCVSKPERSTALGLYIQKRMDQEGGRFIHAKISADSEALFFAGKISSAKHFTVGFCASDFSYLNCANIFKPILFPESQDYRPNSYFILKVKDRESQDYGLLLGRF